MLVQRLQPIGKGLRKNVKNNPKTKNDNDECLVFVVLNEFPVATPQEVLFARFVNSLQVKCGRQRKGKQRCAYRAILTTRSHSSPVK